MTNYIAIYNSGAEYILYDVNINDGDIYYRKFTVLSGDSAGHPYPDNRHLSVKILYAERHIKSHADRFIKIND